MNRAKKAEELFMTGLNCAQSVAAAFADVMELSETAAAKLACGLGGGVGRQREICGAVSGAAMVLGFVFGGENGENKKAAYEKVRAFSQRFREKNGSMICRELLSLSQGAEEDATPQERTNEYYEKRPCAKLVCDAAEILEAMLDGTKA